jgi:hypothetical protein
MFKRRPSRISVGISPGSVVVSATQGVWRRKSQIVAGRTVAPDKLGVFQHLCDMLSSMVTEHGLQGSTASIVMSDALVRQWLVDPPSNVGSLDDLRAAAASRFQSLFGESPVQWDIRADLQSGRPFVAAALLAFTIFFYAVVYSMWLKRLTPQNIVIGGAAGAFPPMVGWVAATGSVSVEACLMFMLIFMWTPPHFWALSLWAHGDYARAKVPMLPVTHGARETRRQVMIYTVALVPVTLAPWFVGFSGLVYAGVAALLGAVFLVHSWRVLREAQDETGRSVVNDAAARATFRFSLYYLFVLFGALAIDRLVF